MDAQSIAMFLAKPHLVSTGDWTSASLSNSVLESFSILDELMASSYWTSKMTGYKYMRATAVVRLELNAQPFQAGRLLMHFLPQYAYRSAFSGFASHNANLTTKTQQNGIEIDTSESSAVLKIPYISPYSHVTIGGPSTYPEEDWGTVFLTILSPLSSLAATNANYSIFLSFEDVELVVPVPEMNKDRSGKAYVKSAKLRENKEIKSSGVISTAIGCFSDAAEYLRVIPGANSIIDKVQDVAYHAGSIFSAFGFAKPLDTSASSIFVRKPARFWGNFNGLTQSDVLALDAANSLVPVIGGAGVSEDEMSFNYLKTIPALIDTFTWNTTDLPGTQLYENGLKPSTLVHTETTTVRGQNYTVKYTSPAFFIARYFAYYRGSIKFTFKFVKTPFHTGRLMVVYDTLGSPVSMGNTQNALREIIDLKDSYEFSFTVPYLANTSYSDTGYGAVQATDLGSIKVFVLNDLAAASTVAQDIEILVYVSGGEDFELAKPSISLSPVVIPEMNNPSPILADKMIGGYQEPMMSLVPMQSCIGEAFCSLKQLILTTRFVNRTFGTINNSPVAGFRAIDIWPWIFGLPCASSAPTAANEYTIPPLTSDYLSEISSGYAYYRGGIRYCVPPRNDAATVVSLLRPVPIGSTVYGNAVPTDLSFPTTQTPTGQLTTTMENLNIPTSVNHTADTHLDTVVPYYGYTPFRFTTSTTGLNPPIPADGTSPNQRLYVAATGGDWIDRGFMRSAADDFTFHYFVGFIGFL